MIIFLRRIPENTKKKDIADFIEPVLKGKIFQKSGHIEHIKILILKDSQTHEVEYHSLVTVDSDEAAKRVIKKLNRKAFKGKHITVKEYIHRSWHNDPRINMQNRNKELIDKRKSDRRRPTITEIKGITSKISARKNFHRIL